MCVSLASIGDMDSLEIWSLAGADLTKPGFDGRTAIQVVGLRVTESALKTPSSSQNKMSHSYLSQAEAFGQREVMAFLTQLMSTRSVVITAFPFCCFISLKSAKPNNFKCLSGYFCLMMPSHYLSCSVSESF